MTLHAREAGFQDAVYIPNPAECFFYHSMDLPEFGLQIGDWDLRNDVDNYLGNQTFGGKTVVDVGTASGFLAFEMEKRGANVVAFDRNLSDAADDVGLIPYYDFASRYGQTFERVVQLRSQTQQRLRNSFWLSHRLLNSEVRLYAGNAYSGIVDIGMVDYSFFGSILLHLRDPLLALSSFAKITREKMIITDTREDIGTLEGYPVMFLRANVNDRNNPGTWWYITQSLLQQYLGVLGFTKFSVTYHQAQCVSGNQAAELFTIVAER
jgi:hypothetical protein